MNALSSELSAIIATLKNASPDIEDIAIVSSNGLHMANNQNSSHDKDHIAAVNSALLNQSKRVLSALKLGTLELILVCGNRGNIIIMSAAPDVLLSVLVNKNAKIGFIVHAMKGTANQIKESAINIPSPRMGLVRLKP